MIEPAATATSGLRGWARTGTPLGLFVVLGLPAGAIGVAWPPMRASFGAPLAGLGLLLAAITVAYFAGSAVSGPLGWRLPGSTLLMTGCILAAAGLGGVAAAPQWWLLPIVGLPAGLGFGLIDAGVNTQVSLQRGVRYMGWLHASWAIGAAIGPQLVVASLLLTGSWRGAFALTGGAFLLFAVIIARGRRDWRGGSDRPESGAAAAMASAAYRRATMLLAALLFVAAGLEATAGDWSYSHLTLGRGMTSAAAGWAATLFWAGLAGGRIALGTFGNRLPAVRLLDIAIAASAIASLLFWLTPQAVAGFIALPLLGFSVSVIYPLLLSVTPARVGASMTGHAVGYSLAAGTVGGGALPAAIGVVLQAVGLAALGPALVLLAAAVLGLHLVNRRASSDRS
jgi:fucose permease